MQTFFFSKFINDFPFFVLPVLFHSFTALKKPKPSLRVSVLRVVFSVLLENVIPGETERVGIEKLQNKFPTALTDIWAVKLDRKVKCSVGMLMTANERSELFSVSDLCLTSVSSNFNRLILKYYEYFQVIIYCTYRLHHSPHVSCPSAMTLHFLIY